MESKAGFFHGSNGGLMVIYHGKSKKSPKKNKSKNQQMFQVLVIGGIGSI